MKAKQKERIFTPEQLEHLKAARTRQKALGYNAHQGYLEAMRRMLAAEKASKRSKKLYETLDRKIAFSEFLAQKKQPERKKAAQKADWEKVIKALAELPFEQLQMIIKDLN